MKTIHCPRDIGLVNTFDGEDCKREQFYNDCYHCWASAIADCENKSRPQGEWIKTSNDWIDGHCGQRFFPYHCGCCGYKTWDDELTNYCPNCGAIMESEE